MKKRDMRKLLYIIITLLFFLAAGMATNATTMQDDNQPKSANSPQLTEADKLSAQVVKLYNEDKFAETLSSLGGEREFRSKKRWISIAL